MRRLLRATETRGAIYVEFLIAFFPVFMMFLSIWQYGLLVMARLVVEHAAVAGARAAAVVIADAPDPGQLTEAKKSDVRDAVFVALAPLILHRHLGNIAIFYPAEAVAARRKDGDKEQYEPNPSSDPEGPNEGMGTLDFVRVRVEADFLCRTAPVNTLVCGGLGARLGITPTRTLKAEAAFPYQGARYTP